MPRCTVPGGGGPGPGGGAVIIGISAGSADCQCRFCTAAAYCSSEAGSVQLVQWRTSGAVGAAATGAAAGYDSAYDDSG